MMAFVTELDTFTPFLPLLSLCTLENLGSDGLDKALVYLSTVNYDNFISKFVVISGYT